MPQGIEWFEGLSAEEQSSTLRLLSHFCIQARATAEDGPECIRRAGLRATHTPAVLITRGRIDQQLGALREKLRSHAFSNDPLFRRTDSLGGSLMLVTTPDDYDALRDESHQG